MTFYEIQNDAGDVVAVIVKFDDGKCLVKYARTCFESVDQIGAYLNKPLELHEVASNYYERGTKQHV